MRWSPDGRFIAAGSFGEVRVWELSGDGHEVMKWSAPNPQEWGTHHDISDEEWKSSSGDEHVLSWSKDGLTIAYGLNNDVS
jgi:WD40-like Beta Propeller Repeat